MKAPAAQRFPAPRARPRPAPMSAASTACAAPAPSFSTALPGALLPDVRGAGRTATRSRRSRGLAPRPRAAASAAAGVPRARTRCSAAICTPGILMTHEGVPRRERRRRPSTEIREALSGNLCRCTGYQHIVDAVLLAARSGSPRDAGMRRRAMVTRYFGEPDQAQRGPPPAHRPGAVRRRRRAAADAARRVRAQPARPCAHPGDRRLGGAPARAWSRSTPRTTSATIGARAAAGPAAADRGHRVQRAHAGAAGQGQGAACRRAGSAGHRREPLPGRGRRGDIVVDYEPLPAVIDLEAALQPGSALVHDDLGSNIAAHVRQTKGDYAEAAKRAATRSSAAASSTTAAPRRRSRRAASWRNGTPRPTG